MHTKKIFIIILLLNSLINGDINPIIKSAILPGWGQLDLVNHQRSRVFMFTEFSLLVSCIGSYVFSKNQINNYQSFSANHAGVNVYGKNHKYWVDIGNYNNYLDYNDEHLRFRESDDLYSFENKWEWDSIKNKKKFKKMRINADLLNRQINFFIGAIIINHIISSIDAMYLYRLKNNISVIQIYPRISNADFNITAIIEFDF